ncbi:Tyrosyl-tRNA synthetase [Hordeum vulgare]|nr:Tyrosyl-tRNA synthetase [Hordeum vulgare]
MVEALVSAASYIKGAHVDLNMVPRDDNEEDDVETIKLPVVEEINDCLRSPAPHWCPASSPPTQAPSRAVDGSSEDDVLALAEWLGHLADKGVEDLTLADLPFSSFDVPVQLPATLLRCGASLCRLYLGVWLFPFTTDLPRGPDVFPNLQELSHCHGITGGAGPRVKIGHATQLAVLGYLDTATHQLEIGNTIIKAGRDKCLPEYSGSNFQASSLATTPTTSMTRAKSSPATSSSPHSGRGSVDQMREKSHVKKLVFDQFSGGTNQVEFLSLVLGRAVLLQKVIVLLAGQESISVCEAMSKLQPLASKRMWASKVSGKPSLEVGVLAAGHVWR